MWETRARIECNLQDGDIVNGSYRSVRLTSLSKSVTVLFNVIRTQLYYDYAPDQLKLKTITVEQYIRRRGKMQRVIKTRFHTKT